MKIMQVVEKLDVGGLEKIVLNLSNKFAEDNEILIISLQDFNISKINKWVKMNEKIRFQSLYKKNEKIDKWLRFQNIFKMILKLRKEISDFRPDVIHTHHVGPLFYSVISTCFNKTKIIHTEHDIWYLNDKKNRFLRKYLYKIKKHKTIALSNRMATELKENYEMENISSIFNGIDIDRLKIIKNAKEKLKIKEKFVIGTCGRIEDVKNQLYLIEQARKQKDVRFLIAGSGSLLDELKSKAPDNVTFLGHQNDLSLFFSAIDVFCLSSKNEGFPLSILEAYYYNKPVFSTNVGNINEIIRDDYYFFRTNEDLDIEKMKRIKEINMKEKIKNHFSLNSMTKNYLLSYKE